MSLMAHPDDCELLAAGTLALLVEKGWEIHIVSMTPGDAGSVELDSEQIAAVRRVEGAVAAKVIGATYHCLESRDLYITFDETTLRRAVSLARKIAPSLVLTHSLEDYIIDHEVTARIARTITFGYSIPNVAPGSVPKGVGVPHLYYADPLEGKNVYGDPVEPTTIVDIGASIRTKTKMLKAHASQRQWLLKHHGLDQYIRSMKQWAGERGSRIGVRYAEGFRHHRGHAYPLDCILKKELGSVVRNVRTDMGEGTTASP